MNETPPTPPTEESGAAPGANRPRRLLRSNNDRMLGGVAGGLAEYFRIDPVLIRIGFAITGLMGIGLFAYLALFIFVPEDDGWGNPVQARERDRLLAGGAILLLLIAIPGGLFPLASLDWWWGLSAVMFWLAVLAGAAYGIYRLIAGSGRERGDAGVGSSIQGKSSPGSGQGHPGSSAAAVGSAGGRGTSPTSGSDMSPSGNPQAGGRDTSFGRILVMIVAFSALAIFSAFLAFSSAWGAAVGGAGFVAVLVILCGALIAIAAFKRPMRWLIVPALALALPAAAVQAADFELDGGYGDRVVRPARLADIPEDGYRMAAGNLTIDLRQADWRPGSTVKLPARLNFGQLSVIVPDNVCVASDIDIWAGGFEVLGDSDSDFRVQYRRTLPDSATPKLDFEGKVDLGWVEVITRMPYDEFGRHRHGLSDPEATQPAHCLDAKPGGAKPGGAKPAGAKPAGAKTKKQEAGR